MTGRTLTTPLPLNPTTRAHALHTMATTELDVLVIGAGVVGAGTALDAVTRGLRVGLVEARDYASGTSSRSSKLIHGGLRYLKQLDFGLVFEALRERSSSSTPSPRTWPPPSNSSTPCNAHYWTAPGQAQASASTTSSAPAAACPPTTATSAAAPPSTDSPAPNATASAAASASTKARSTTPATP